MFKHVFKCFMAISYIILVIKQIKNFTAVKGHLCGLFKHQKRSARKGIVEGKNLKLVYDQINREETIIT